MHLPTYELPRMHEEAGAAYAWPPWPVESSGCPYKASSGCVGACPDLAIAGALFAHEAGYDYEAIAGYLDERAGELVAGLAPWEVSGLAPWEEAISGSFLGGLTRRISNVAKSVARTVSTPVTSAAAALVHGVRQYNPVAIAKMAAIKARALAGSIKDSVVFNVLRTVTQKAFAPALAVIRTASHVLPYAQTVVSFVPGIGSGIGAALGAAQVLADGKSISDAAVAAVRGAIPGGPLARTAFDTVWNAAHGRRVDTAVLAALRDRIPGGEIAKRAADTALALAAAKTAQERRRLLQGAAVRAIAPQAANVPGLSNLARIPAVRAALPRFV